MRLLLDTHIWLWSLLEPERLSLEARDALQDPENQLWLSPISIWETLMLAQKGRLNLSSPAEDWVKSALEAVPLHEAYLTFEVAVESQRIELPHRDPADRFLAASARVFGLTLITADERLLGLQDVQLLSNP